MMLLVLTLCKCASRNLP